MRNLNIVGVVGVSILVTLTSFEASAATRFGAKLTNNIQPSNAGKGHFCVEDDKDAQCTWVMMQAFDRNNNGYKAPKDGMIGKIRLIGCRPGSFQLQIARANANTDEGRVLRNGPTINYQGDSEKCGGQTYDVETINLDDPVPVKKNDQLAIKTNKTSTLRCDSGGDKILLFNPPLAPGDSPKAALDGDGCWMLIEAEYLD
jgi:hypothetical protein